MAKIAPFRGIRYNLERIEDPASVMAPPYDIISPELQETLYARSPYNVVRLILGRVKGSDSTTDNRYTRAAADFNQWQKEGVLQRDEAPLFYLYDQEYVAGDGERILRKGVIALTRIEDFTSGVVKPHEQTIGEAKDDRMRLIQACDANFSPIFGLYADPCCVLESLADRIKDQPPALEVTDDDGAVHRLWPTSDEGFLGKARELLDSKPLFIADGHHRYETALGYRDLMREKHPEYTGKELFNYVLMYFANMEDRGVTLYPTHRLVTGLQDFDPEVLQRKLEAFFTIETASVDPIDAESLEGVRRTLQEKGREEHTLAMYAGGGEVQYLSLRDPEIMDRFFADSSSKALRTLDVSILHRLIFEEVLRLGPEDRRQEVALEFLKRFEEPFARVAEGKGRVAFLMNPTRLNEVRDIANAGEKMPPKSTYFYPKLLTGMVINKIVADERIGD